MHRSTPRAGAMTAIAASILLATTPAARADIPTYPHCRLYNSGSDHLSAYCSAKARGSEFRVVARCGNGRTSYGPWRRQGGTYASTRYCPKGSGIRGGDRQVR